MKGFKVLVVLAGAVFGIVLAVLILAPVGQFVSNFSGLGRGYITSYNVGGAQAAWTTGSRPQTVEVTVVDASGNPMPGIQVIADHTDGTNGEMTDINGHATISVGGLVLFGIYIREQRSGPYVRVFDRATRLEPGLRGTVTITDLKVSVPHAEAANAASSYLPCIVLTTFLAAGIILIVVGVSQQQRDRRKTDGRP